MMCRSNGWPTPWSLWSAICRGPEPPRSLLGFCPLQFLKQADRRLNQHFAGALRTARADHLVIPLRISWLIRNITDRAVGELRQHRVGEGRCLLDRQSQLDKNLAG